VSRRTHEHELFSFCGSVPADPRICVRARVLPAPHDRGLLPAAATDGYVERAQFIVRRRRLWLKVARKAHALTMPAHPITFPSCYYIYLVILN